MSAHKHELARMLDQYRKARSPDAGVQSRVWTSVEASVAGPAPVPSEPPVAAPAPGLGAGAKLAGVAVVIALGAAGLWLRAAPGERAGHAPLGSPAAQPAAAHAPQAPSLPKPPAEPATRDAVSQAPRLIAKQHAQAAQPTTSSLAQELKLVTAARAAVEAGRHDRALGLLRRHAQRFPQGALAEERDAALVEALCGLGRTGEAAALAERFVARFPGSPRSSRVREACTEAAP